MMALESLLSESQTSNLTLAQNEQSPFTPIFFEFYSLISAKQRFAKCQMRKTHCKLCYYLHQRLCKKNIKKMESKLNKIILIF